MKQKLANQKLSISADRLKWQGKLDSLNRELDEASDRAYNVKRKGWQAIQAHIEKLSKNERQGIKMLKIQRNIIPQKWRFAFSKKWYLNTTRKGTRINRI